jgi:hypothetical protein
MCLDYLWNCIALWSVGQKLVKLTPEEQFLTENLDQYKLNPETSYHRKFHLTVPTMSTARGTNLIFFQCLDEKNPDGESLLIW